MAKRSLNYCESCARTWYPRGQDLSDQCPSCKSTNVTFDSLRRRRVAHPTAIPGQYYAAPRPAQSGCATVLVVLGIVSAVCAVMFVALIGLGIIAGSKKKKNEDTTPTATPIVVSAPIYDAGIHDASHDAGKKAIAPVRSVLRDAGPVDASKRESGPAADADIF